MSDKEWNSILIPMIRKLAPTILAQEIVGVQPMNLPPKMRPSWELASEYMEPVPNGYVVINANLEVSRWIEEQPIYMWKHGAFLKMKNDFYDRYIISEKLLTWLKMRWS